jgi:hypothetical protein
MVLHVLQIRSPNTCHAPMPDGKYDAEPSAGTMAAAA